MTFEILVTFEFVGLLLEAVLLLLVLSLFSLFGDKTFGRKSLLLNCKEFLFTLCKFIFELKALFF